MYSVIFESDTGEKYVFGKDGNTAFDMDVGNGVSVNIGTSQGFSQIGETMQSRTVAGRQIKIHGVVYGNVQERKTSMRRILSPFSCGRLVFDGRYFTRVCVKSAPTFSPVKNDGRFSALLFAPYPFFYDVNGKSEIIGAITPMFSFPVNYANPHRFGAKSDAKFKNIYNDSDVKVPFSIYLSFSGKSTNPIIANLRTFQKIQINGSMNSGDVVNIFRDENNVLNAQMTSDGVVTDIISWISEDSDLFELEVGDNLISANDDDGGTNLTAKISFNTAVVALYES